MRCDVYRLKTLQGKRQELEQHIATIPCANQLSLLQRKSSDVLLYHAYHKSGLKAAMVWEAFKIFISEQYPQLLPASTAYQAYVETVGRR